MWKVIAESVEGTSHRRTSKPCQDHCRAQPVRLAAETVLIVVCADGAGSAELSEIGSRLACDRFFDVAYGAMSGGTSLTSVDRSMLLEWYRATRQALKDEAAHRGVAARELACTLLTALIGHDHSTFAQVGDGSIVFWDGNRYESAFWPQTGEYANVTNFITQDSIDEVFEFVQRPGHLEEIAVFTDGLQRLALSFATRTVHQQFFKPMFDSLRTCEHADELIVPVRSFLDSERVNERTDDDKTLVLAARVKSNAAESV